MKLKVPMLYALCLFLFSSTIAQTNTFEFGEYLIEAENAVCNDKSTSYLVDNDHKGHTGSGFVNAGNSPDAQITWVFQAKQASTISLAMRYASTSDRPVDIIVNGKKQYSQFIIKSTGDWAKWDTIMVNITIQNGKNEISFDPNSNAGLPNIDHFSVANGILVGGTCGTDCNGVVNGDAFIDVCGTCAGGNTSITPEYDQYKCLNNYVIIEAENHVCDELSTNYLSQNNNTGYTGSGFVNSENTADAQITWIFQSAINGPARIVIKYASVSNRPASIIVNKNVQHKEIILKNTGSWTKWTTTTFWVDVIKGRNEISIDPNTNAGLPNIDHFLISEGQLLGGSCGLDCNNEKNGNAFVDICGQCSGGNTSIDPVFEKENCGLCVVNKSGYKNCDKIVTIIEAETAVCKDKSTSYLIENNHANYTGTGFVNSENNKDAQITWVFNSQVNGEQWVVINYASDSQRPIEVLVNGKQEYDQILLKYTGGWASWDTTRIKIPVKIGINELTLDPNANAGLPNIDHFKVSKHLLGEKCSISSISENTNESKTFYPNPTHDKIFLSEKTNWEIFNLHGVILTSGLSQEINVSNLKAGLYMIKLDNSIHRFIKID